MKIRIVTDSGSDLSDEEADRWLGRHKDEMDSAKQDLASRQ